VTALEEEVSLERVRAAACAGTTLFALALAWLIVRRTALTMDERHTLLIAQAIAGGDSVSFYVGSVTRYEGGSWLIAWPVALLLKLGASGTAATSWTAGAIAIVAVGLGSLWVGRFRGWQAALLLGPVCAAFPEGMHYAYRAWGSLCEALVMLPVLAFLHHRWAMRGRTVRGSLGLGAAFAVAWVLSYFHFVTTLAFAVVEALEARGEGRSLRASARSAAIALGTGAAAFLAWVFAANPHPGEAWVVRDGRSLASTLTDLLLPRLDLVFAGLPGAVLGELTEPTLLRWAAVAGILVVAVVGAARVAGSSDPLRRTLVFALLYLPALGVGHALLDPPEVYRYYLPLLAALAVLIAAGGWWTAAPAVICGAAFWLPSGLAMPYQNPSFTVLELGSNAMHRYAPDPHVKFKLLRSHIPEYQRRWFAFGYGVDSGRRCSPTRAGGAALLAAEPGAASSPHLSLQPAAAWTDWWGDEVGRERADYFFGLGVGFAADGALDRWEAEVLAGAAEDDKIEVLLGLGAAITRALEQLGPFDGGTIGRALVETLSSPDVTVVGRGMAAAASAGRPDGADLGLIVGTTKRLDLEGGLQGPVNRSRRAMVRVPTIPTPHPMTLTDR